MKPEDKRLVFQDLCARLPYHVRCKVWLKYGTTEEGPLDLQHNYGDVLRDAFFYDDKIKDIKPYLRPMSSMTEEEHNEWFNYYHEIELKEAKSTGDYLKAAILGESASIDWLNKNMFDYRGLIEKGFAIEVTKDNNPYKD